MTSPWPHKPFTFRALSKTFGPMWLRCDVCRRYARFRMVDGLADIDYRTKTFSCSQCGSEAYMAVVEPIKETGMVDYRLDELDNPQRHQAAADRLTGRHPRARVNLAAGELPGRKIDGRR